MPQVPPLLPTVFASDEPTLLSAAGTPPSLRRQIAEAKQAWLAKSSSRDTRSNYDRDLSQFLAFAGVPPERLELLADVRPAQVAAWRDHLLGQELANSSVARKMTVLRSLYSYLQSYGYIGRNPAHSDFVDTPTVPRDGKTVALSTADCRRLLDAPSAEKPRGIRDRALLSVLAYTGIRVGELVRLKVGSYKQHGVHRILEVHGKGGKERRVPIPAPAAERLEKWIDAASIRDDASGSLFRPQAKATGFGERAMTRRAVQKLMEGYVKRLGLDSAVTVHSLRVTALTTARVNGSDILDLQDFAGHADPRTTLTYIRQGDRLSDSPAYAIKY
jgi:integrase/recombinase XerD